ncbi:MAG TPA: methyl-accepting chemotaxis protein, partial [Limnobacter sp.]|nr:methyl-accepting chemotaxis protein [Limnobacter sp.]
MNSWSIAKKLNTSIIILSLLAISILTSFAWQLQKQASRAEYSLNNKISPLLDEASALNALQRARINLRDALLATQSGAGQERIDHFRTTYRTLAGNVDESIVILKKREMSDEAAKALDEGIAGWAELKNVVGRIEAATMAGDFPLATELLLTVCFDAATKATKGLSEFAAIQKNELEGEVAANYETSRKFVTLGVIASLLAIGLALTLSMMTIHNMRKSLNTAIDVSKSIEAGDLTVQAEVKSEDEVGRLLSNLNLMARGLRTTVASMIDGTRRLKSATDGLGGTSEVLKNSSTEVAESTNSTS